MHTPFMAAAPRPRPWASARSSLGPDEPSPGRRNRVSACAIEGERWSEPPWSSSSPVLAAATGRVSRTVEVERRSGSHGRARAQSWTPGRRHRARPPRGRNLERRKEGRRWWYDGILSGEKRGCGGGAGGREMVEQGAGAHEVAVPVAVSVRVRFVERSGKGDGRLR
jgi:hypothetical protein